MNIKPSNWYQMNYQEQKEWERTQRQIEDAEWEKKRVEEEAENERYRMRREMQQQANAAQAQYEDMSMSIDDLNAQIEAFKETNNGYLALLEELWPILAAVAHGDKPDKWVFKRLEEKVVDVISKAKENA